MATGTEADGALLVRIPTIEGVRLHRAITPTAGG
jgi:hypothetical protein